MRFLWRKIDPEIEKRVDDFLDSWLGTPYMAGQRVRCAGVDCVQLGMAFLDAMAGSVEPTHCPRLSADVAIHSVRESWPTVKALRHAGTGSDVVREAVLEPGDLIVTRASPGPDGARRPGHLMILTSEPMVAVHAIPFVGVCRTSIEVNRGIVRIYRPRKESWVSQS